MSGKPNVEQVRKLREALTKADAERREISDARREIEHRELRVSCATERLAKLEREIRELMREMDCEPGSGNAGHEQRMTALLTMLSSEATAK